MMLHKSFFRFFFSEFEHAIETRILSKHHCFATCAFNKDLWVVDKELVKAQSR